VLISQARGIRTVVVPVVVMTDIMVDREGSKVVQVDIMAVLLVLMVALIALPTVPIMVVLATRMAVQAVDRVGMNIVTAVISPGAVIASLLGGRCLLASTARTIELMTGADAAYRPPHRVTVGRISTATMC